jgi:hypothetical protein
MTRKVKTARVAALEAIASCKVATQAGRELGRYMKAVEQEKGGRDDVNWCLHIERKPCYIYSHHGFGSEHRNKFLRGSGFHVTAITEKSRPATGQIY